MTCRGGPGRRPDTVGPVRRGGIGLRLLVVLPVLLGLVAMHALVAPPSPHATPPGTPMGTTSVLAAVSSPGTGHPAPAGHAPGPPASGGHDRSGDHDGATHVLHLCLVVLAAVGLVLVAARLFLGVALLPVSTSRRHRRSCDGPAERPPPLPRRLARLCVLRT